MAACAPPTDRSVHTITPIITAAAMKRLCRLVEASTVSEPWIPDVCKDCPVPAIARANACEHMTLQARVAKGFLGFGRKIVVEAYCVKAQRKVDEPQIGCGQCHGDAKIADLFNE